MSDDVHGEIEGLFERLDSATYYEVLGIAARADYLEIRATFHARAQTFHPDRFIAPRHDTVRKKLYQVYKRMTEAYRVLVDPEMRALYDEAVARGELRLDSQVRGRRRTGAAREIANPLARVYLASGREKFEAGDLAGAQMDAELGLSLERAPALEALHTEVVRSMVRPGATSS